MPISPIRCKPHTALNPDSPAFERIQTYFKGDILLPSDTDFPAAIAAFPDQRKRAADDDGQEPSSLVVGAIVYPKDEFDVAAVVRFATAEGIDLVVRDGGQDDDLNMKDAGGIIIDLRRYIHRITPDSIEQVVHVGGGAQVEDLIKWFDHRRAPSSDENGFPSHKSDDDPSNGGAKEAEPIAPAAVALPPALLVGMTAVLANGTIVRHLSRCPGTPQSPSSITRSLRSASLRSGDDGGDDGTIVGCKGTKDELLWYIQHSLLSATASQGKGKTKIIDAAVEDEPISAPNVERCCIVTSLTYDLSNPIPRFSALSTFASASISDTVSQSSRSRTLMADEEKDNEEETEDAPVPGRLERTAIKFDPEGIFRRNSSPPASPPTAPKTIDVITPARADE